MHGYAPYEADAFPRVSLLDVIQAVEESRVERRGARRRPFDFDLLLTPLDGIETVEEPLPVRGRDLSLRGVGFEHSEALTHRKVRLAAADPRLDELGFADLEIDVLLKWCRFLGAGNYVSGGRVTRTTAPLV